MGRTGKEEGEETGMTFYVGEPVTWLHEERAGYGYITPVDGEVVSFTPHRVRIKVKKTNGDEVIRTVKQENLRKREA